MKIVIIGHTGFIGKNIFENLIQSKKYDIVGLSTDEIDLTKENSKDVLSNHLSSDCVIIMCAGLKKQLGDNLITFENNMFIINNFCKAILEVNPQRIIYLSSATVYGEDVAYLEKISEYTPVQPKTYYGIAKYAAERVLEKICTDNGINLVNLRPPLVYGKDDLSQGYGPTGFTYKAVNNEKIILWGDGSEFREFIYVDDVGKMVSQIINSNYSGILNVVSGISYTYEEILTLLRQILGMNIRIESRERTKEKVDHHYSSKLIRDLMKDFSFTSIDDGLKKMYKSIIS